MSRYFFHFIRIFSGKNVTLLIINLGGKARNLRKEEYGKNFTGCSRPQDTGISDQKRTDAIPRDRAGMRRFGSSHPPTGQKAGRRRRHPRLPVTGKSESDGLRRLCDHRHPDLRPDENRTDGRTPAQNT